MEEEPADYLPGLSAQQFRDFQQALLARDPQRGPETLPRSWDEAAEEARPAWEVSAAAAAQDGPSAEAEVRGCWHCCAAVLRMELRGRAPTQPPQPCGGRRDDTVSVILGLEQP